jgi:ribosomal protein L29
MKYSEILTMSEPERKEKELELRKELMKLYGQVSTGTNPAKPGRINQIKKTLAKILTYRTVQLKAKTKEAVTKPKNE